MHRLVLAACVMGVGADAGAQSVPSTPSCEPIHVVSAAADTVFQRCAVDTPARLQRSARPSFWFREQYPCATVELEFVVAPDGRPLPATALVMSSTSMPFADQVVRSLPRWRYAAARRSGLSVSQLVRIRFTLADGPREPQPAEDTRMSRRAPDPCR